MKMLAIIPARGGSKGVPGKNFRPLHGKPLLAYSIEAARHCAADRIVVSTDSPELAEIATRYGAEVPFLRPAELAGDNADLGQVVDHARLTLTYSGYFPDAHIVLVPTSPFRTAGLLDFLCGLLREGHTAVQTARRIRPARLCRPESGGGLVPVPFPDCEPVFRPYGIFSGVNHLGGKSPYVHVVTDPLMLLDIDTMDDFSVAEAILEEGAFDFHASHT